MFGKPTLREHATTWVDRAIDVQDGPLRAYLVQAAGDVATLENQYLATVSGAGAAVGGAASIPGVGTGLAVGLSVAETVGFLDATALFTLAVAELRGCRVTDLPRRRALLLLVLLGDDAVRLVPPAPGDTASDEAEGWGHRLVEAPDDLVAQINETAEKWLLTRFGARQGLFVLGRLAPFGIGAAVGAAGNALTAKGVIARVRSAFAGATSPTPAPEAAPEPAPAPAPEPATAPAPAAAPAVDPPTGKYAGLFALLASLPEDEVSLRIAQIDEAVTGGLPAAARRNADWWSNDPAGRAPQVKAWLAAGLHVGAVELADETVRTVRMVRGAVPAPVG